MPFLARPVQPQYKALRNQSVFELSLSHAPNDKVVIPPRFLEIIWVQVTQARRY